MIYQDKTPALEENPADQAALYPTPRAPRAREVNHRAVRGKAPPGAQRLALLNKVKGFKSAAQLRALGLYP